MGTPLVACTFIKLLMDSLHGALSTWVWVRVRQFLLIHWASGSVAAFPQILLAPRVCGSVVRWGGGLEPLIGVKSTCLFYLI